MWLYGIVHFKLLCGAVTGGREASMPAIVPLIDWQPFQWSAILLPAIGV